MNTMALPEMIEWLRKIGYEVFRPTKALSQLMV